MVAPTQPLALHRIRPHTKHLQLRITVGSMWSALLWGLDQLNFRLLWDKNKTYRRMAVRRYQT
jgi:hypothetical protein